MKTIVTYPNLSALKLFAEKTGASFNGSEAVFEGDETPRNFASEFINLGAGAQMHLGTGSDILDTIQRQMKKKGMKTADVAALWGVHPSVASKFLNNTTERLKRIEQLMQELGLIITEKDK